MATRKKLETISKSHYDIIEETKCDIDIIDSNNYEQIVGYVVNEFSLFYLRNKDENYIIEKCFLKSSEKLERTHFRLMKMIARCMEKVPKNRSCDEEEQWLEKTNFGKAFRFIKKALEITNPQATVPQ